MNERQNKNNIIYETDILNPSIQLLFYFTVSGIFSGPQSIAGATLGIWSQWRVNYKMQQMVAKGSSGRSSFSLAAGIANLNDLRRRNCLIISRCVQYTRPSQVGFVECSLTRNQRRTTHLKGFSFGFRLLSLIIAI